MEGIEDIPQAHTTSAVKHFGIRFSDVPRTISIKEKYAKIKSFLIEALSGTNYCPYIVLIFISRSSSTHLPADGARYRALRLQL